VHRTKYRELTGQKVVTIPSITAELLEGASPLKILFFATEEKMPALLDDVRALFQAQGLSPHLINGNNFLDCFSMLVLHLRPSAAPCVPL
jgi:hypothetical protein